MPHQVSSLNASHSTQPKIQRARQFLSAGGITRDDSDDELGLEDLPWEWIYSKKDGRRGAIEGARMGSFQCMIGDCVLLKAEGNNEAWVGLICNFVEEEDDDGDVEMAANFMWFSTNREIRNKQKRRTDAFPYEVYITPSWDVNPLVSINGKATVVSADTFQKKFPNGKVPRSSRDYGKIFICRRGCNTRTATYTDEFNWENEYRGPEDLLALSERVQKQTKATRKRRRDWRDSGYNSDVSDEFDPKKHAEAENEPKTPSKKRKYMQSANATPTSKRHKVTPHRTPTSGKRIVLKKPLTFTPLTTRVLSPTHTQSSPFQVARSNLHVSSVPASLPCRTSEFTTVYSHLESAITAGTGACIYISGTPGTGKTATVREVIAQLNASVQVEELDDFIFVEINGMKVTDPHQSYSLLWEALKGERVSSGQALGLLTREFDHPSPRRVPCVVLMDELDQLVTKNQSVMYNFFNWPGLRHSRLIVLAVANTMDLPERTLSNKISSRLGLMRILFPGYSHEQLQEIIRSRLEGVIGDVVDSDAIQFASRKVAAVSGDARRALDICRRAVEIAESEDSDSYNTLLNTPSKNARKRDAQQQAGGSPAAVQQLKKTGRVTIQTIKRAINEATSSPLQEYLKNLPLSAKLFLAALLAQTRRTGINETTLAELIESARKLASLSTGSQDIGESLNSVKPGPKSVTYDKEDTGYGKRPVQSTKVPRVLGMNLAASELAEAGIIGLESGRKGERAGKVKLRVGDEEVGAALKGDAEMRGLGFG